MREEVQNHVIMFEVSLDESMIETEIEPAVVETQAVIGAKEEDNVSTG